MEQLQDTNDAAGAQSRAGEAGANLTVGLGVTDRRDRLDIIMDLASARKTIYDLREALNEIILLPPERIEGAYIIAGEALAPKIDHLVEAENQMTRNEEIKLLRQDAEMCKKILCGFIDHGGIPNWVFDLTPNV